MTITVTQDFVREALAERLAHVPAHWRQSVDQVELCLAFIQVLVLRSSRGKPMFEVAAYYIDNFMQNADIWYRAKCAPDLNDEEWRLYASEMAAFALYNDNAVVLSVGAEI